MATILSILSCPTRGSPLSVTVVAVGSYQYVTVVPAIEAAAARVNQQYAPHLVMNVSVVFKPALYECEAFADNIAHLAAANYYRRPLSEGTMKIFVGPKLNVLFASTVGTDLRLSDKRAFPTTMTTSASHHTVLMQGFQALLAVYNWTTLFLICDDRPDMFYYRAICRNFQIPGVLGAGVQVNSVTFNSASPAATNFDGLLGTAAAASRIIFLSMSLVVARDFMIHAKRNNKTTSDYVYFSSRAYVAPNFPEMSDTNDSEAREAFRQLFIVMFDSKRIIPYDDVDFVKTRSATAYNYTYGPAEPIGAPVIAGYETILVIAEVLHEALSEGGHDLKDARTLVRHFLNRTFILPTGSMYINENGDRFPDLVVQHLIQENEHFEAALTYCAATRRVSAVNHTVIHWIDGKPPSGRPGLCGFDGKHCSIHGFSSAYWAAILAALAILTAAETLRRFLTKPTAHDRWWLLAEIPLFYEARISGSQTHVLA
ncbi:putative Receptor-type guanylate cyclase gcy-28 [Hypsibius exemplaris]|uniref:Receptor-type guanylate cyclase gcy-28 n=1 Tax=Hypsibius exemplaris TaxID=2072580 RepID=A0A1W0XE69_HYPEX|nr:putative Receptor-type guanylate cyclase gcy-28 [Hypsibius exemplaris]